MRQAQPGAHSVVAGVMDGETETVGLHVGDPVVAAAAVGVFPDLDGGARGGAHPARRKEGCARQRQCGQQQMAAAQAEVGCCGGGRKSNAFEQVTFLKEKKAITEEEAQRLNDMIESRDRENFEIVKYIIAEKSLPFLQTKSIEKCLYNSKPTITVTQAPIL